MDKQAQPPKQGSCTDDNKKVPPAGQATNQSGANAASTTDQVNLEYKMICMCMGVSEADIKRAVENGAQDFLDVQAATNAGMSCGTCPPQVEALVKKYKAAKKAGGPNQKCCGQGGCAQCAPTE